MKLGRLNHVGVATPSIEQSLALYRAMFGAEPHGPAFDLPAQGVRVCFVDTPNSQIELIEPLGENSPIVKFLEKNPLGGQHHVCFEVPDIHAAKAEFEAKGARVLGEPRIGAHGTLVFFVHPKDMGGVLTEIMEIASALLPFETHRPVERRLSLGKVGSAASNSGGIEPVGLAEAAAKAHAFELLVFVGRIGRGCQPGLRTNLLELGAPPAEHGANETDIRADGDRPLPHAG
jgi:methylmalonyl-CoA/ethylmalonyl-CoA epimerase